ncbi:MULTISPECIES: hypothetical protein [Marinobacterium]|uniref:Uncharacterized protein n=2 Tax=Marinobacterium TaxID=48075 RepID=A0A1H6DJ38_9GAMM|nr:MULTISPECIES: hypothetical protein [Marinobacterium]TCK03679.1 hypothetical protein CLV83_3953 [Marinobacterium mangrovicola]SEG84843.1 hypothetical protein SAMN05444390_106191 [Marinobacterium lutimaris]
MQLTVQGPGNRRAQKNGMGRRGLSRIYQLGLLKLAVGSIALLAASQASAHYPFCSCELNEGEIHCTGGFSDGSSASGVTVDMISYDEEILANAEFDGDSRIRFERPDGEFYILLDAGPGHVVEVDWHDVEGLM